MYRNGRCSRCSSSRNRVSTPTSPIQSVHYSLYPFFLRVIVKRPSFLQHTYQSGSLIICHFLEGESRLFFPSLNQSRLMLREPVLLLRLRLTDFVRGRTATGLLDRVRFPRDDLLSSERDRDREYDRRPPPPPPRSLERERDDRRRSLERDLKNKRREKASQECAHLNKILQRQVLPPSSVARSSATSTVWTSRSAITGHLHAQFPSVENATVHGLECVLSVTLVVEPYESEPTRFAGKSVPRYIDVPHASTSLENSPQVLRGGPVRQVVHLGRAKIKRKISNFKCRIAAAILFSQP